MFSLSVRNKYGERLELTHNPAYSITDVDGIDPPEAIINTTRNANFDGEVFNSSFLSDREITITLVVNKPAEENRIRLYRYFKSKMPLTLFWENGERNIYIDGYVKKMQVGFFDKKQTVQIIINCPRPQLNGARPDIQEFSTVVPLFEFPFSIEEEGIPFSEVIFAQEKSIVNHGDLETGVKIVVHAMGPIVKPKIYNVGTQDRMIFNITLGAGDDIIINTIQGEKNIKLRRNGVETNAIGYLDYSSSWFVMAPGDNVFTVAADSGVEYMQVTFTMIDQYEGV